MYYVIDIDGDGYTTISKNLTEDYYTLIGEYSSIEEARKAASNYEEYIENEVAKASGNFYDD